jgi:hypothetical protein
MRRVVCTMPIPLMAPNVVEFGHIWVHSSEPGEQWSQSVLNVHRDPSNAEKFVE